MNWAGGDPLLSTFIAWSEGELVRLLFHELAHQVVYVPDDTLFNESFATAVERLGSAQWLSTEASAQTRAAFAESSERRSAFRALARTTRARLAAIYEQNTAQAIEEQALIAIKNEAMQRFRDDYAALRTGWLAAPQGQPGALPAAQLAAYDRWVARANNASFAAQAAYDEWVPAFEALFEREGRQWPRFYDAVRQLAQQPEPQRHQSLRALPTPKETPGA